jgi:arylsulfatase
MAIYAAMVDSMDQNIGRILSELEGRGERENTLVVFTSDNGACAEWDMHGFDGKSGPDNTLHRGKEIETMGSHGTFHSAGSGWANASNTPWRLYKHYNHEGGIAVPCIVHWPARMQADQPSQSGRIDATPTHLIDILPTFLAAAGQPSRKHAASSLHGQSLLPLIANESLPQRELFFEHEGNRAVRSGRWKLVALRGQPWELYDMNADRTELNDLASQRPNLVKRLAASWDRWASDNHVTPLPRDYHVPYVPVSGSSPVSPIPTSP